MGALVSCKKADQAGWYSARAFGVSLHGDAMLPSTIQSMVKAWTYEYNSEDWKSQDAQFRVVGPLVKSFETPLLGGSVADKSSWGYWSLGSILGLSPSYSSFSIPVSFFFLLVVTASVIIN